MTIIVTVVECNSYILGCVLCDIITVRVLTEYPCCCHGSIRFSMKDYSFSDYYVLENAKSKIYYIINIC